MMHFAMALHIAGGYTSACAVRLKPPSTPVTPICFRFFTVHQVYRFTRALELPERGDDTREISQKACPFVYKYLLTLCALPERTLVEIYCVDARGVLY